MLTTVAAIGAVPAVAKFFPRSYAPRGSGLRAAPRRTHRQSRKVSLVPTLRVGTLFVPLRGALSVDRGSFSRPFPQGHNRQC